MKRLTLAMYLKFMDSQRDSNLSTKTRLSKTSTHHCVSIKQHIKWQARPFWKINIFKIFDKTFWYGVILPYVHHFRTLLSFLVDQVYSIDPYLGSRHSSENIFPNFRNDIFLAGCVVPKMNDDGIPCIFLCKVSWCRVWLFFDFFFR